ncbi:hypothetical protein ACFE04_015316 [Oxalis oulophora]
MDSEIKYAIEELSMIIELKPDNNNSSTYILMKPFLNVCNAVLQVLDKIGSTMSVIRQDIRHNIQILENQYECDPPKYSNLIEILEKEANEGIARKGASCSKAVLWLTRCLDFTVALLQRLMENEEQNMEDAVEDSYTITLRPWHGWISSTAFRVALKLVPDNRTFIGVLMATYENYEKLQEDMEIMVSLLSPILQDCHSILSIMLPDRASPQSSKDIEGFTLHFGDKFNFNEELNVVEYVGGRSHHWTVQPKELTMVDLKNIILQVVDGDISYVLSIHFKKPSVNIDDGLHLVNNDEDLEEFVVEWALDRKIEVYVEATEGNLGFDGDDEDGGCSDEESLDDVSFCSKGGDDEFTKLINNAKSYTVDTVIEEISMSDNDECVVDNAAWNDNDCKGVQP